MLGLRCIDSETSTCAAIRSCLLVAPSRAAHEKGGIPRRRTAGAARLGALGSLRAASGVAALTGTFGGDARCPRTTGAPRRQKKAPRRQKKVTAPRIGVSGAPKWDRPPRNLAGGGVMFHSTRPTERLSRRSPRVPAGPEEGSRFLGCARARGGGLTLLRRDWS